MHIYFRFLHDNSLTGTIPTEFGKFEINLTLLFVSFSFYCLSILTDSFFPFFFFFFFFFFLSFFLDYFFFFFVELFLRTH